MYHFRVSIESPLGQNGRENIFLRATVFQMVEQRVQRCTPSPLSPLQNFLSGILPGSAETKGIALISIVLY